MSSVYSCGAAPSREATVRGNYRLKPCFGLLGGFDDRESFEHLLSESLDRLKLALGVEYNTSIVQMNDAAKRFFHVVAQYDAFYRPRHTLTADVLDEFTA